MYEKASVDKHLFLTDVKAGKFELRTPEYVWKDPLGLVPPPLLSQALEA